MEVFVSLEESYWGAVILVGKPRPVLILLLLSLIHTTAARQPLLMTADLFTC